jgi:hypothetical protein
VSQVIAELEHAVGVKLFDRNSRGVVPTTYARALQMRARTAFDELRQGIRDIEFLADPTAGELTIGYPESTAITISNHRMIFQKISTRGHAPRACAFACLRVSGVVRSNMRSGHRAIA